jgi:predicted MFS family arabinose efflux permease
LGALVAGGAVSALREHLSLESTYRCVIITYAVIGGIMACIYAILSASVEAATPSSTAKKLLGLRSRSSRCVVAKLSALFTLDAFAGGFTTQTFIVLWFSRHWLTDPSLLGVALMAINLLAAASGLVVGPLVARFGAVNVMVFTHLPSNVLNMLVPLMPSQPLAVGILLLRFSISQMDVPARQAFVAISVASDERSSANGLTTIARSIGLMCSPMLLGLMANADATSTTFSAPWFVCGALKVVYDCTLYALFKRTATARAIAEPSVSSTGLAAAELMKTEEPSIELSDAVSTTASESPEDEGTAALLARP